MGTTITKIDNVDLTLFAKFTNPKGETSLEYPQNRQYLSAVLHLVHV